MTCQRCGKIKTEELKCFAEGRGYKEHEWGEEKSFYGVGMPQALLLQHFGEVIYNVFGEIPYQVGSSITGKKNWRDVDVRLILPDERYKEMGLGEPENPHRNKRWRNIVMAFSLMGKTMTGLPIDFQIQQQTHANKTEKGTRSALFDLSEVVKN